MKRLKSKDVCVVTGNTRSTFTRHYYEIGGIVEVLSVSNLGISAFCTNGTMTQYVLFKHLEKIGSVYLKRR